VQDCSTDLPDAWEAVQTWEMSLLRAVKEYQFPTERFPEWVIFDFGIHVVNSISFCQRRSNIMGAHAGKARKIPIRHGVVETVAVSSNHPGKLFTQIQHTQA
jgi:hypothetical protein